MSSQTGTIEITGLSQEILQTIERRARDAGSTAEAYLRTLIEQEYALLTLSSSQIESLRHDVEYGRDQIRQGQCHRYDSPDAMMDDVEAELRNRLAGNPPGVAQ